MNSLVVEIMNNGDNATANDKFINGYFALYRLLLAFKKDSPDLGSFADEQIQRALKGRDSLKKDNFANLGEFLIYLSLSDKYEWKDVSEPFMRECDARNVFWYAKGNRNNPPKCPELLNTATGDFAQRAKKVFEATVVSRRLVMFQVRFISVAKNLWESGVLEIESGDGADFGRFGLVPDCAKVRLKGLYQDVVQVNGWTEFFEFVGMVRRSDVDRGSELVEAVKVSKRLGYT